MSQKDFQLHDCAEVFGESCHVFGPPVHAVLERAPRDRHIFIDKEVLLAGMENGDFSIQQTNHLIISDFLQGCHLAALLTLLRSRKWFAASMRSYQAEDLLSWSNNTRALIESTADFFTDLSELAASVADHKDGFLTFLRGRDDAVISITELEDRLEHFFHARKLSKVERRENPEVHQARQTWEYVRDLERHSLDGLYELYSQLSEISHPSKQSLWDLTSLDEGSGEWTLNNRGEKASIDRIISQHRHIFRGITGHSFTPGLLMLRILVKFDLFSKHPELKKFDFSYLPYWRKIEHTLKN
ncbi:MAG: hypothetical protein ACX930_00520 [Erythrobacter sp.]